MSRSLVMTQLLLVLLLHYSIWQPDNCCMHSCICIPRQSSLDSPRINRQKLATSCVSTWQLQTLRVCVCVCVCVCQEVDQPLVKYKTVVCCDQSTGHVYKSIPLDLLLLPLLMSTVVTNRNTFNLKRALSINRCTRTWENNITSCIDWCSRLINQRSCYQVEEEQSEWAMRSIRSLLLLLLLLLKWY